jgi:arylsulfatase A-like enzyme
MDSLSYGRRRFLKTAGAAALAASFSPRAFSITPVPSTRQPNILMLVADDQRYDTIAALGNSIIQTPNFDRLTKGGFAFTRARCMGGQNPAVCVPSRAQLTTGRTVFHVPDNTGGHTTLGQSLMAAGYETYGGGKWHNGKPSFMRSFHMGNHVFLGGMDPNQYTTPICDFANGKFSPNIARTDHEFSSNLFTDPAVDFLRNQTGEKPFFCYIAFTSPHDPRTPPPPYDTMYDPAKMSLPDNWLPQHPFDNGELKIRDELLAPFPRTPKNTRKQLCDYYGMVTSQDAQLGRMLDALEQSGQLHNTIVVYTSDHGLSIGSHGLFGKQSCYEEAQRIPMLLMGPGVPHGRSDALVYGLDLFPTLCEMSGTPTPTSVEGKSLSGIMKGKTSSVRASTYGIYAHSATAPHAENQQTVCDGRWKYIQYKVGGKTRVQLFDLQNDPTEIHDLSQDATAAPQLPRLADLLRHSQSELNLPAHLA